MPSGIFEAFKAELVALRTGLITQKTKTIRDEQLCERFRNLFRGWVTTVRPNLEPYLKSKRDFFKLEAELENLAKLTSKYRPVTEYKKRIARAIELANQLVLFLPVSKIEKSVKDDLFLPNIPDLPLRLVPNPLLGWKSRIEAFLNTFPFDKSVFIMIRYRRRNEKLISDIKKILSDNGYNGVLASEHNLTNDLYNPIACLLSCSKGIAVFDRAESEQVFNPNVAYELGMLHLLGRESLILKHRTLRTLHTDILMKLYSEYENPKTAKREIVNWIKKFVQN